MVDFIDYIDCNAIKRVDMASITIRNLDDALKAKLRQRAAKSGHSMEEEARQILRTALSQQGRRPANLYEAIRRRIAPLGGVELEPLAREPIREPPKFE